MSRSNKFYLASILVLGLIVCGTAPGWAEGNNNNVFENEIDKDTELQAEDVDEADLVAFVEAAEEVQDIRLEFTKKMHDDEGDEEKLKEEATQKMREAIEEQGLDEETYRGIAYHVREDDDLLSDYY
ncbi:MAG: DUF4168 domain-containing protein [Desulfohalobiaceae bacterium]